MWVRSLGQEDPLEEGMATHCSIIVWRIPWTQEPDRLHSVAKSQTRLKSDPDACMVPGAMKEYRVLSFKRLKLGERSLAYLNQKMAISQYS